MSEFKEELLMFAPKSARGLRMDYPEIREVKEFQDLRPQQLLFVWYLACKTSPYYDVDDLEERDIIKLCLEKSKLNIVDPTSKAEFLEGKFPDRIKAAIPPMQRFEPSIRILARIEAARMILDYKKLTSLNLDDDGNHTQFMGKDGDVDFNKKQKYHKMLDDGMEALPRLIAKAEQGFGIIEKSKSQIEDKNLDESGKSFGDTYHENN